MPMMWEGRFQKAIDESANDFQKSINTDRRMYRQDILGSVAHAEMLGRQGIIDREDAKNISDALSEILRDIENGKLEIDDSAEDIHMFVEAELTKRIGDAGKRLHTARSRNDQVATDLRMYLRDEAANIKKLLANAVKVMTEQAKINTETIMPGYTHLQRAQPISFGHYCMAYASMLRRDIERLDDAVKRINVSPLGCAALAGTTYNINRDYTAEKLGFTEPCSNSLDGVSDRDFVIELASCVAIIMMHLSRICEELVLWSSLEFKFIEMDDAFTTGSSIMPQKKNPDMAELIRGKCGRAYGNLVSLLTMMKGLPLAYNKDMQEDKEAIFDSVDTVKSCLEVFIRMFGSMKILKDNMRFAAGSGFINATDCADYLVKKGLPFRSAYKIVGRLVAYCIENEKTLENLTLNEFKSADPAFEDDVYEAIRLERCLNTRKSYGGPGGGSVERQIAETERFLLSL